MTISLSVVSDPSSDGNTLFQNSVYIGIVIEDILYGVELLLYFKTIRILLSNRGARKKSNIFYALFSSMMVFSITVWVATQALFGQQMWLLESDFPGGPDAYWSANIWVWYMDWGTTAVILLQLMTDGLMIYRCRIIWNSYRVIVVPIILWLASLVLGVLVDWTSSSPGGDFYTGVASQFGLAYCTVSVVLSTILASMICYRLVRHGKRVQEHLGHEYASSYFAVVTLVIESVLPYTISGIAFLVSLGVGSPTSVAFVCVYFMMMCISPQMLILRVLAGRAWDNDTSTRPDSPLGFRHEATSGSQWIDSGGARVRLQTISRVYLPDVHGKVLISQV